MRSSLEKDNTLRRVRPLLGTFVEIKVSGEEWRLPAALEAAFSAVMDVQEKMSFHRRESDVSRLNRQAFRRNVAVSPETWDVLSAARALAEASEGAFDVTVAPQLVRWGYLPRPCSRRIPRLQRSGFRSIQLFPGSDVRFLNDVWVDLGGIAKGYAVDRACLALESRGVFDYVVNAGGDLRIGHRAEGVRVRHPSIPGKFVALPALRCGSVATSAATFSGKSWRGKAVTPMVSPRRGDPLLVRGSVSVVAQSCMVSDALTKVVTVLGEGAHPILEKYGARALWVPDE